jgi:S1-C subfamily serine protease
MALNVATAWAANLIPMIDSHEPARSRRRARALIAAAGLALLFAACSLPVRLAGPAAAKTSATPAPKITLASPNPAASPGSSGSSSAPSGSGALASLQADLRQLISSVMPSVVQIDTSSGLGSGVVMDTAGDIVTNAHVVGTDNTFTVTSSDGHTYPATLVGSYPTNDLAVIKVNAGDTNLPPATFGDSSQVHVGDVVLALGSPLGLTDSVSEGIVSALGRAQSESQTVTLTNLIQTTAALNPGNSGGALIDISGHVIGIPTLAGGSGRGGSATNIGFAIPSSQVQNVTSQLNSGGAVTHSGQPYLGITVSDGANGGGQVVSVVSGGPSDKAGVKANWVITSMGAHPIANGATVTQVLSGYKPGAKVDVVFKLPDGSTKTVTITLGERPTTP